jgi:hypothetical protein
MQERMSPLAVVYRGIAGDACRRHRLADGAGGPHRALADWGYLGEPVSGAVLDTGAVRDFIRPLLSDLAVDRVVAATTRPMPTELADRGYMDQQARPDYRLDVFGDPSNEAAWAWRLNGPHVGLHFAVASDGAVSAMPLFIGRSGSDAGDRAEASLAQALVDELTADERCAAMVDRRPPIEIRTRHDPRVFLPGVPDGVGYFRMGTRQRSRLDNLVLHHLAALRPLAGIHGADLHSTVAPETVRFAYAGRPTSDWYYCVKSRRLVIEYLNKGGHVHCVMRDAQFDWAGLDQMWPKK